ncbi:MAG: DUF1254 domain-containing protein [Proteobacteria bacterium]|nr:DUF1254 domain-containing protein [Pseudomonadota bacterium]
MNALTAGEIAALAAEAYTFGFPTLEMQRVRYSTVFGQQTRGRVPMNTFRHGRKLISADLREVTAPNNDTIYSSAWLDLSAGPIRLSIPATEDRYYSFAFMDFFTNVFAILGRRNKPGGNVSCFIAGPDWKGQPPQGVEFIRSPTNAVWLLARFLVDGPDDVPAVNMLQDGSVLTPSAVVTDGQRIERQKLVVNAAIDDPAHLFGALNSALAENPPPARDAEVLKRIAAIGVAPGRPFHVENALHAEALLRGVEDARARLKHDVRALRHAERPGDWCFPASEIGDFKTNYWLRAIVALAGLAALPPAEAMYLSTIADGAGAPLHGANRYSLRFPKDGMPPAHAFWSITLYEIDTEGRAWFARNGLKRYSIGDRTPGLKYETDGSLTIEIAREWNDPANVLPAPEGPFFLSLRVYEPGTALLDGTHMPPPVVLQS